jgi:hypothetical protein
MKATVQTELDRLPPAMRNKIQKLAYQIGDALKPLALLLESADCELGYAAGPLLEEHLTFCEMLTLLEKSKLTKCL